MVNVSGWLSFVIIPGGILGALGVGENGLIRLLADGEFHSGEEIGALLGVSRTAVWKQFKKLESLGLALESRKGRGYRVVDGLQLLDAAVITKALPESVAAALPVIDVFQQVDSTNSVAAKNAPRVPGHRYLCLAEQQTTGRGRRGRVWQSPFGRNVYLSLVWQFSSGAAALEGLSLSIGVAVVRTLGACGAANAQLKWPNDVLYGGRKIAGILLEMQGDPAGICQVIIGVGVNLDLRGAETAQILQPWIDLHTIVGRVDRNQFVASLVTHLYDVLEEFSVTGFARLRDEWSGLDAFLGQDVLVQLGEQSLLGRAVGVDESGGLKVNIDGVQRVFRGGEISLRSGQQ